MSIGPVGNLDEVHVRFALEAATAASPVAGDRPWRFRCTERSIELYSELGGHARTADPGDRAIRLQCGAALLNLRLAIRAAGVVADVRLLPDPRRADFVASVGCTILAGPMAASERRLVEVIHHGTLADRSPGTPLPAALLGELRAAARVELAWLSEITEDDRSGVEHLLRSVPGGDRSAGPLLVSIGSLTDQPLDHITAGQATQRVALSALAASVSVSSVPQLIVGDDARLALRRRLGGGLWPQSVLSVRYPSRRTPAADGSHEPQPAAVSDIR